MLLNTQWMLPAIPTGPRNYGMMQCWNERCRTGSQQVTFKQVCQSQRNPVILPASGPLHGSPSSQYAIMKGKRSALDLKSGRTAGQILETARCLFSLGTAKKCRDIAKPLRAFGLPKDPRWGYQLVRHEWLANGNV